MEGRSEIVRERQRDSDRDTNTDRDTHTHVCMGVCLRYTGARGIAALAVYCMWHVFNTN